MSNDVLSNKVLDKFFSFLNEAQLEMAKTISGPLLVLAGAGTGKTTALVSRVVNMLRFGIFSPAEGIRLTSADVKVINSFLAGKIDVLSQELILKLGFKPIDPSEILIITFTNKAVDAIKDKLFSQIKELSCLVNVGTFHSEFTLILRDYADKIGFSKNFSLFSESEQREVLKECVGESLKKNAKDKTLSVDGLLREISIAKNTLRYDKISRESLYQLYQDKLRSYNAMDFDDILVKTYELLKQYPDVLSLCREKFRYIMIDEYQDTSPIQYKIVELLTCKDSNICVVGDDDQSIYGFRGADIGNILNFEKSFSSCKVVKLEQNYRSTKQVLDVANTIISHNFHRKDKKLWSDINGCEKVKVCEFPIKRQETQFVSNTIKLICKEHSKKYSDFAILYRKNYESNEFQTGLMQSSIPYEVYGGMNFYERIEIRSILDYFEIIVNPDNDVALKRIMESLKCGIGKVTSNLVQSVAMEHNQNMLWVCINVDQFKDKLSRAFFKIKSFSDLIVKIIKSVERECKTVLDVLSVVLKETDMINKLNNSENVREKARIQNIKKFKSMLKSDADFGSEYTLETLLNKVRLRATNKDDKNVVSLMTCHAAKGLEFSVVFVVGMEDGSFPLFPRDEGDELEPNSWNDRKMFYEEERRLFYVAATRAKEFLFLTRSIRYDGFQGDRARKESRFITELRCKCSDTSSDSKFDVASLKESIEFFDSECDASQQSENVPVEKKVVLKAPSNFDKNLDKNLLMRSLHLDTNKDASHNFGYSTGDVVFHSVFGNGIVKDISLMNSKYKVDVLFGDKLRTFDPFGIKLERIS